MDNSIETRVQELAEMYFWNASFDVYEGLVIDELREDLEERAWDYLEANVRIRDSRPDSGRLVELLVGFFRQEVKRMLK